MINVNLGSLCGHPIPCPNVRDFFFFISQVERKKFIRQVQRSRARFCNRYIGIGGMTYTGDMT